MANNPLIVIMGLDPEKHKIPPLLMHHLKKIQKDFLVSFDPEPDKKYQGLLQQTGFKPTPKELVQQPKSGLLDAQGNPL